eukprot:scaffold20461_cov117-Cylindrotheca_fusiformis.AAC.13
MDAYTVIGVVADKDAAPDTSLNSMVRCQVDEMKNEFSSEMLKSTPSLNSVPVGESSSASARTPLRVDLKSSELKIMSGSSSVRTNDSMLSDLTINKFNIQSMGLIGREREIDILKSCYHRMMEEEKGKSVPVDKSISTQSLVQSNLHKELVFVSGYSGVGKSSLAKTLKNEIVGRTAEGIYVEGKFDSNASDEPYSGISSAFGQICKRILERQDQSRKNAYPGDDSLSFGSRLLAVLGPSTNLLSNLIPELQDVLPVMRRNSDNSGSEQCDFDMLQERVKYAFRVLMRTLNAELSPIVLVLDDLQWADSSSLEVVDFLISDLQNPKALMIVVCYRSNEVDEHSQLFKMIQTLQVKQEKFNFHITDVTVGSCDIDSVNKIIMAMMSIDDEERTLGLAEVCFKRTAGNPFFLIEFMVMLHEEKLILYNLGLLKWIWDEERIAEETMSTDNVVDLLQARMRKMPANVQLLLQYAACLGSSFSASTLDLIWRKQSVMSADFAANTITDLLAVVISSNFVEACGENEYHWVHDKVQEAALLLNDIVTPAFQFEIGTALLHSLDANGLEEHLFDVVDLINKGRVSKRHEFAKLNLRAAEKAKKISAFRSAAKYAANGIELLPSDKWTIHRSLTLALYTIGSEVELALGRYETEEIYSDKVLNRKECTLMEALPLKMAKSLKLCHVDMKFKESIEINLGLLKDLGVKLLWSRATTPMQSVTTLMRTIKMAKKAFGPEEIVEKLGHMEDAKHRAAMLILSRVCYASFRTGDFFLNILCGCKRVEMTLKYGVCDDSPVAFSALGQVAVIAKQDYGAAAFFAELALALQKACRPSRQSESLLIAHGFCVPWSRPLQQCSAPFADGYASGMRSGDTVNAMWCLLAHQAWLPYTMGKRLGPMLDQCPKILSQMEELSQPEQATALKIFWQTLLNLVTTPVSKDAQKLEGAIFSAEGFTGAHAVSVGIMHRWQGELLVYYDFEAAAKTALHDGDKFSKLSPGSFQNMRGTFNRAIALFAMAQRTRKRVYRNLANKLASQIKGWVRGGNPNVRHYHLALMAEQAALSKKYIQAEENYKNAIALAARTGHMHDTALINERYAEFLHEELSDEQESKYRIGEAIRFYKEWGAFGKAEALQQQWLWLKVVC